MSDETNALKIQSGVPIPQRGIISKAFRKMKVGDSILVTGGMTYYSLANSCGIKVAQRKEGTMLRLWRIK